MQARHSTLGRHRGDSCCFAQRLLTFFSNSTTHSFFGQIVLSSSHVTLVGLPIRVSTFYPSVPSPDTSKNSCYCDLQCLSFLSIIDTLSFYLLAMQHLTIQYFLFLINLFRVEFCCLQPNSLMYLSCVHIAFHGLVGKMDRKIALHL